MTELRLSRSSAELLDGLKLFREQGVYPYFPIVEEMVGTKANLRGRGDVLVFGGCDYLGISQHPALKQAAIEAVERFGTNTLGAQIFSGYTELHYRLEREITRFLGTDDTLLFPSGMAANIAVIATIASSNDVCLNDRRNHASIFDACGLSGALTRSYAHKDFDRLKRLLQDSANCRQRIIIVDGLFSTDGDFARVNELVALAEAYDALVIVDEAHSLGTSGPTGRGASEICNVANKVDVITGTMNKAFGSVGGFAAGRADIINLLRHSASFYLNSRGSPPAVVGASLAALEVFEREGAQLREQLWVNTLAMHKALRSRGLDIGYTESPIIPVMVGRTDLTIEAAQDLLDAGLLVNAMVMPAVPARSGRLRVLVSALHTAEEIKTAADWIAAARAHVGF